MAYLWGDWSEFLEVLASAVCNALPICASRLHFLQCNYFGQWQRLPKILYSGQCSNARANSNMKLRPTAKIGFFFEIFYIQSRCILLLLSVASGLSRTFQFLRSSGSDDSGQQHAQWYIEGVRVCRVAFLRVMGLSPQRLSRTRKHFRGQDMRSFRILVHKICKFCWLYSKKIDVCAIFWCKEKVKKHFLGNISWNMFLYSFLPLIIARKEVWGPSQSKCICGKLLWANLLEHCRDVATWLEFASRWVGLFAISTQRTYDLWLQILCAKKK